MNVQKNRLSHQRAEWHLAANIVKICQHMTLQGCFQILLEYASAQKVTMMLLSSIAAIKLSPGNCRSCWVLADPDHSAVNVGGCITTATGADILPSITGKTAIKENDKIPPKGLL